MLFEHHSEPVLPRQKFWGRVVWHLLAAVPFIAASLAIGAIGFHLTEKTPWLDALLNSAMLLGGMGPTGQDPVTDAGKWFSIFFALYSGLVLVVSGAWVVTPVFHRVLHKFHANKPKSP